MPNFSGIWTVTQQMQAKGASTWPATPGAPTIGTATLGASTCASVTFCAPACTGYPAGVTGYRVVSTPGCIANTGASSPIVVSGLTGGTSYTFKAQATNTVGYGAFSAASNSVTPPVIGQDAFTTAGTYSWVAPSGVTSVSIVAVGGGGRGGPDGWDGCGIAGGAGGGGGGLSYINNRSVTVGNSYTVVVGAGSTTTAAGGNSYFCATGVINAPGGSTPTAGTGANGGVGSNGTGGKGGNGKYQCEPQYGGGGGAAGYSGTAGQGGTIGCNANQGFAAAANSGGAGGGGARNSGSPNNGGGGVGILGRGTTGGVTPSNNPGTPGSSGSTGASGVGGLYGGGGGGGSNSGAGGAVRIIYPGSTRSFPITNTGNL
jgi:hypothetical protein